MTDWSLRPAEPRDYPAVGDLVVRVYESIGPVHPEYAKRLRAVADRAARTELYVAESAGGDVVGAVTFVPGPGPESSVCRDGEAEVRTLAVDPAWGGRGIGEALVRLCLQRARQLGRTAVVLSTMPWMTRAHRLYELIGFRRTPDRDWSPRPGFDCLTYALDV